MKLPSMLLNNHIENQIYVIYTTQKNEMSNFQIYRQYNPNPKNTSRIANFKNRRKEFFYQT